LAKEKSLGLGDKQLQNFTSQKLIKLFNPLVAEKILSESFYINILLAQRI
jgi:hypothetical protein